ncbi:MAG TPA: hypothetical protein VJ140_18845, partial [Actinomycetota bacterium]|nr:hypothetical protein [Actinomycetota bacterium]
MDAQPQPTARAVTQGDRLASVQGAVEGLERPWVFALEWGDPPFNGGHWVPEMLQVAGGEAIIAVDASAHCSRPGPRLVDGVEILAAALHPGWLPPPPAGTAVRLRPRPHR